MSDREHAMNTELQEPATPRSSFLFRIDARMEGLAPLVVRDGPYGTRLVAVVSSGQVQGPRVAGILVPGCSGDWVTVRKDGLWHLDVRAVIATDDGATILYAYTGIGTPIENGRIRVRGVPRFETADPRYVWLNGIQSIALGEADPRERTVFYDMYSLE